MRVWENGSMGVKVFSLCISGEIEYFLSQFHTMNSTRLRASVFTIFFTFLLTGFSFAQSASVDQVIKLNDSYNNVQKKGAPAPKKIQVKNPKGFILDCTGYDFTLIRSVNKGKDPDLIFIIARGGKYKVPLNLQSPTLIDAGTMVSIEGYGKNFSGFEKGDEPIFAIGTLRSGDDRHMLAFWVSMIQLAP
jgi:hypothetical protein